MLKAGSTVQRFNDEGARRACICMSWPMRAGCLSGLYLARGDDFATITSWTSGGCPGMASRPATCRSISSREALRLLGVFVLLGCSEMVES